LIDQCVFNRDKRRVRVSRSLIERNHDNLAFSSGKIRLELDEHGSDRLLAPSFAPWLEGTHRGNDLRSIFPYDANVARVIEKSKRQRQTETNNFFVEVAGAPLEFDEQTL
jgi:hypothetical protein